MDDHFARKQAAYHWRKAITHDSKPLDWFPSKGLHGSFVHKGSAPWATEIVGEAKGVVC